MSNGYAIAAVTATLRSLLISKLGLANVSVRSLDKAREGLSGDQINLFLYHTEVDAAWRNMDMPRLLKPGETGHPPMPLSLFYIVTAYDDKEVRSYSLLGNAIGVLHDHPLLDASEIQSATASDLTESDLHEQIERVRITFQPLSIEEMYKLWAAFQTQYRPSVAYQVSVVLIESKRPSKAPLPVLTRGKDDSGITSQADVAAPIPPFPVLLGVELPDGQTSALLGKVVTLTGHHLDGATPVVRFSNPNLTAAPPVTIMDQKENAIQVQLDNVAASWVAGFYTVAVDFGTGADLQTTNELPLTVAPRIASALPLDVTRNADTSADITLDCSPQVRPAQRASLLLGDREIAAKPHLAATATLDFTVPHAPLGEQFLRLRIDGVDSLLIQRPADQPPIFDATQRAKIHD